MLYFRQILILLVSLYTVRGVLKVLGAEDYGIYNVVAGVVTMCNFLSNSMASATQRYFSYDLGRQDFNHLKETFSSILMVYIFFILLILLIGETVGVWFLNHKLVISKERLYVANIIFQCSIVSFIFTLITTPFMALIIAHEDMSVYAYVSIIEASMKLVSVILLKYIPFDKLLIYGVLLCFVSIINTSIYRIYCHKYYKECVFRITWNKDLLKELISYSGWNLLGSSATVVKNQVMNILLNIFFGPIINAARGIAAQVNGAVISFGQNFSTALRPQVIKKFANQDIKECNKLVFEGTKITYFLMYIIILPLLIEMDFVLSIWLGDIPDKAVLFSRLVLIDALVECLSYQLMTLVHATGKIKWYQIIIGGIVVLNCPISLIALKFGAESYVVLVIAIVLSIVAIFGRLLVLKRQICFNVKDFLVKVVIRCFIVSMLSMIIPVLLSIIIKNSIVEFCCVCVSSIILVLIIVTYIGLSKDERVNLITMIKRKFKKENI